MKCFRQNDCITIVQTLVDDFQFVTNSILNVIEEAAGIPDRVDVKMPHAHRISHHPTHKD